MNEYMPRAYIIQGFTVYNKKKITQWFEDIILSSRRENNILLVRFAHS